jgi:hypothetical protein
VTAPRLTEAWHGRCSNGHSRRGKLALLQKCPALASCTRDNRILPSCVHRSCVSDLQARGRYPCCLAHCEHAKARELHDGPMHGTVVHRDDFTHGHGVRAFNSPLVSHTRSSTGGYLQLIYIDKSIEPHQHRRFANLNYICEACACQTGHQL